MFKFIKIIIFFSFLMNNAVAQRITVKFVDVSTGKRILKRYITDSSAVDRVELSFVKSLRARGYLEASVDTAFYRPKNIICFVHKGQRYYLDTLIIIQDNDTNVVLKKRQVFSPGRTEQLVNKQLSLIRNKGYPFAHLIGQKCNLYGRHFSCIVRVDRGDYYVYDTLTVLDSERINTRFLQNYLSLSVGKPFSYQALRRIPELISHLDFLTLKDTPSVVFYPGLARPILSLSRRRVNSAQALIGLHYENGRLTTVGHLSLHLRALFQAEDFALSWDRPRPQWQQLKMNLQVPYIFGLPAGVNLHLFGQKIDTSQLNVSFSAGLAYYFRTLDYLRVSWQSENNLTSHSGQSQESVRKRLVNTTIFVDTRDNSFVPMQGFLFRASMGYGRKILLDSASWSMNYSFDLQKFTRIRDNITLLFRARSRALFSPVIFDNEVMHLGGYEDFRGFGEQQLTATSFYLITFEPRLRFGQSYLLAFAEKGFLQTKTVSTEQAVHTFAAGLGINLKLKKAMLNITYALGTTGSRISARGSKIHISYRLLF